MPGASSGHVVAGGNGNGNQTNHLKYVTKIVIDKNGTLFICDRDNKRVQRWFKDDNHGQTIIANIPCWGLAMDNQETLYISDLEKHQVTKWLGDQIVAGGNGHGQALSQLGEPVDIFIDRNQSVFIADFSNDLVVDQLGTVYVVDSINHRIIRWLKGSKYGSAIIGGHGIGSGIAQLAYPEDLQFDKQGNLYVVDLNNNRVQMFTIDKSSCAKGMCK
ncbi:unnamed protein product [Rotaria magnacalcarata]|uniref:Uncharacterized protein n=1 Tax=Rotaria magnacalcarata TaxID=392030 RepID=A0A816MXS5_9BILA|nr:unnamed protein product [Rotaria magnacalcarata]CAF3849900.1 unnamed protein product [Rotaria magnacalcarata]CAF3858622.1 unnamed protein product [Rotaria magnacalcarata]CAF3992824.1 unnamed protein product [Rotaria magnacalcarata]